MERNTHLALTHGSQIKRYRYSWDFVYNIGQQTQYFLYYSYGYQRSGLLDRRIIGRCSQSNNKGIRRCVCRLVHLTTPSTGFSLATRYSCCLPIPSTRRRDALAGPSHEFLGCSLGLFHSELPFTETTRSPYRQNAIPYNWNWR